MDDRPIGHPSISVSPANVTAFLKRFKALVARGRYTVVPRDKNLAAMTQLGLTPSMVKDQLLQLTEQDYSSGPSADHDREGQIWIFGPILNGTVQLYVKLKEEETLAKILSFHLAERRVERPFDKGGE